MSDKIETMLTQMIEGQARQAEALQKLDAKVDRFYDLVIQEEKVAALVPLSDRVLSRPH